MQAVLALRLENKMKKKIMVSIFVMSEKLVEREFLKGIWEDIHMYEFIKFAKEKGMEKGIEQSKISILSKWLTEKFKFYHTDIRK